MKPKSMSLRVVLALTGAAILSFFTQASAATLYWDNVTGGAINDGAGAWLGAGLWNDSGIAGATWTSGDSAIFGNSGVGGAVTLASPTTVGSITFGYFTGTYTMGTSGQEITLNEGITKNAGAGTVTFSNLSAIKLGTAQTFTNNSATNLTLGAVNLNGNALTFSGSGVTTFEGNAANVMSGAGGIIKNGMGTLILDAGAPNPAHTFTGGIVVNGGAVRFQTATNITGRGNVTLNGGYLGARFGSNATFVGGLGTGATAIQILGGTSGFSGEGSSGSTFTIGTALSTLKWGATGENGATGFFNPSILLVGGEAGVNANGQGALNNAIDLNGSDRTFASLHANWDGASATGFTVNGALTNSAGTAAGIIRKGVGNLSLLAANTFNGATTINGGTITLRSNGAINSTAALNLGGGILRLVNTAQVDRFANSAAVTVSAGGGITYENASGANVYTETLGSVALTGGQLNVNLATNQASTGSQTITFGGLTQSGTSAVTFSAAGTGPQVSGNKNMIVFTGAGTTTAGEIIGSWATIGTTGALQTDYAVYTSNYVVGANIAASVETTWSTTTSATSNFTMSALDSGTLSAARSINSLRSTNNAVTVTASNANIALASHTLSVGDVVTFSAATMPTNLTTGTPYYVVNSGVGTIQVSATPGGTAITPGTSGTTVVAAGGIRLSSGNNLGTTGILNGSATTFNIVQTSSAGVVTLPTTAAGVLTMNTGSGGITVSAPIDDNTGALTLSKSGGSILVLNGVNSFTGNIAVNAGTLQIGTNGTANGANLGSGTYAGNIFIGAGANLDFQTNVNQTLSGVISGDGNLLKRYIGTLTLGNANTYTGKTTIGAITNAGDPTLVVSSFNSVVGGTASSSLGAPTTIANGTIEMGSNNSSPNPTLRYVGTGETTDRIINFTFNSGALRTLDASNASGLLKFTSAFTGSTTTGGLVLTGSGNAELAQGLPLAFLTLAKNGGGTWTLGGAVGSTGTFTLSGATAGSRLNINHRQALGTGTFIISGGNNATIGNTSGADITLTANNAQTWTNNFAVDATNSLNMGIGAVSMGASRIIAVSGAGTYTVGGVISGPTFGITKTGTGTMALSGANAYTGTTTLQAGALVAGANAPLSANGAFGNAASALVIGNASTLAGDAPSLFINGAFTVGRAITVGTGAATAYNATLGGSNTSGTSTFSGGLTLTNTGTYTTTLQAATGGTVDFTGAWTNDGNKAIAIGSSGNTGTVKLTSAISTSGGISVNYGTLLLGSNDRLSNTTPVTVAGGTLDINALTNTVASFSMSSGALNGTGTLTAATYLLTGGTLQANLGAGAVTVNGDVTFSAAGRLNAASTLLIQGGTLTLSGNESVNSFQQTGGTVAGGFAINSATDSDLQSGTFSGNLGGSSGLNKTGAGTTTITGTNSYTGATNVTSGTLVVNGNIASSSLTTVASGATIGGSGTVGVLTVSSGAFINPGNSPGILNTGDYTQVGTYSAEITGIVAGTEHDQINVTGTVDITGGSLTTLFSAGTYAENDLIFILLNDGADAITGTYAGLANGALVENFGGFNWTISYFADSTAGPSGSFTGGNDIALRANAIPEPNVAALLGCLGVLLILRRRR
jgi:autotransporter-associated beta strand protein